MVQSAFLASLPGVFAGALGFMFSDATLTQIAPTASDGRGGFSEAPTDHACKAIVETYKDFARVAAGIPATDRKVIVLGASLPSGIIPAAGNRITVEGVVRQVIAVGRDPAAATYELQAR
jgi:hypothetical protein